MHTQWSRFLQVTLIVALAIVFISGTAGHAQTGSRAMPQPGFDSHSGGYAVINVLNQDQFEGNWKQFKGELKKQWGKFTDDDLLQIEGKYDKFEGKMQERYGDRKEEVKRWTDEWFEKHDHKARRR